MRVHCVHPRLGGQIQIVRSPKHPYQTARIRLPNAEGEFERCRVDIDVVVAYEDGARCDGLPRDEAVVEAVGFLTDELHGGTK